MKRSAKLALLLAHARRTVLAAADSRKRMRPAIQIVPELRPLVAKWTGQSILGMTIVSFLHDRKSVVLELDTEREGMYVLVSMDLEAMKREDKRGLQYNLANAEAVIYNEQNVPKRKVDLSPGGAEVYKNVAEFGNRYLKSAMRKLGRAVQGFMRELPEEEEE